MDELLKFIKDSIIEIRSELREQKSKQNEMEKELQDLKTSDKLQQREIDNINSVLAEIKDDTKFIRRTVQGAVISGVLGIIVTVVYAAIAN